MNVFQDVIDEFLPEVADALSEMFDNIVKHKQEIADVLFDGQPFPRAGKGGRG